MTLVPPAFGTPLSSKRPYHTLRTAEDGGDLLRSNKFFHFLLTAVTHTTMMIQPYVVAGPMVLSLVPQSLAIPISMYVLTRQPCMCACVCWQAGSIGMLLTLYVELNDQHTSVLVSYFTLAPFYHLSSFPL